MLELYPHNQDGYEKVMAHFNAGNRKAAVVHATGTGKSYIAAAVAQHFSNVLVIAPMDIILGETRRAMEYRSDVDFYTYSYVMLNSATMRSDYDLIVMDEYHRSGASMWEHAVRLLIERNVNAKVLGLSATNIRYLDRYRNMADEMFDGHIVSELTTAYAMHHNILPIPTLVECIYSFDETENMLRERIASSKYSDAWKEDQLKMVDRARLEWNKSNGVAGIIKKYITKDIHRIIIFAKNIKAATILQKTINKWFIDAEFRNIRFYQINCKSATLSEDLDAYKSNEDGFDGIKIAIAVNMFNEGVHIDGVDCLIMLRNTISRTIVEQQLGRCLTADNRCKAPIILDMVNNIKIVYSRRSTNNIRENNYQNDRDRDKYTNSPFDTIPFTVIDETVDIRNIIDSISNYHHYTKQECQKLAMLCNTRKEFETRFLRAYEKARKSGWLDEICSHMTIRHGSRSKEECKYIADQYDNFTKFNKEQKTICGYIRLKGWNDLTAHMKRAFHDDYSVEYAYEVASHYTDRRKFRDENAGLYRYCREHKIVEDVCKHMVRMRAKRYTIDEAIAAASTCASKEEFKTKYPKLYRFCVGRKIINEVLQKTNIS